MLLKLKKVLESFRAMFKPLQNHPFGMDFQLSSEHLQPILWMKSSKGQGSPVDSHHRQSLKWLFFSQSRTSSFEVLLYASEIVRSNVLVWIFK